MKENTKNILVTGGFGFIGTNFVHYMLKKYPNYNIIVMDKETYAADREAFYKAFAGNIPENLTEIPHYASDIRLPVVALMDSVFEKYNITDVIHFAAESHVDNSIKRPELFYETNLIGTVHLLECARKYWENDYENHRFHFVSTDEVYGTLEYNDEKFNENSKYQPNSPYSSSKAAADLAVKAYHKTYGLNVTISNCSNNFGPYQHEEKLIPMCIKRILNDESIPVYGDGMNIRDWLYVEDHCKAIDMIFHNGKNGEVYLVGGENELTNNYLIKSIINIVDDLTKGKYKGRIEYVKDRPGHDLRYAIDPSKIMNELGWVPSTKDLDGFLQRLKDTIIFYLSKYDITIDI